MIRLNIDMDATIANRRIAKLIKRLDPESALELIAMRHLRWINVNLRAAGLEKPWQQMAESTIAARPVRPALNNFSSQFLMQLNQSFMILRKDSRAVTVGTRQKYAEYHHFGTAPYIIRPVRAKMLRFMGGDGQFVFARKVNHPGLPARQMLPSKQLARQLAITVLEAAIKRV